MPAGSAPDDDEARPAAGPPAPLPRLTLTIEARSPDLAQAQARLAAFLHGAGLPGVLIGRAELLLEELVMNAIVHGGLAEPAMAPPLRLQAEAGPGAACRLVLEDSGTPFDPTAAALPDSAAGLQAARPGGRGLVLLRQMAQGLRYDRLPEGRNRLTVILEAGAGQVPPPGG